MIKYFLFFTLLLSTSITLADDWDAPINVDIEGLAQQTAEKELRNAQAKALAQAKNKAAFELKMTKAGDLLSPDSKVRLVWFTANDCGYCVQWERGLKQDTSQRKYAQSEAARWILMSIVRKRSLSMDYEERDFDSHIEFIKKARFVDGKVRGLRGYPWFTVYVDEISVMESSQWDRDILPTLDRLWGKRQKIVKQTE